MEPRPYSHFLEKSGLRMHLLGPLDGRKRNERAGVCKGGTPLIGLCILSAEPESMPPEATLPQGERPSGTLFLSRQKWGKERERG